jgi:hypothetical protein
MTRLVARSGGGLSAAALASLAALPLAGCTDAAFLAKSGGVPHTAACQVATTWYPEVVTTPDPAHGGAPVRGIAGRVYLFGEQVRAPVIVEGAMVVDLYDEAAPKPKEGTPLPLEEWRFDPETLKRLLKQDAIGWGYTLFLPWGTYRPEITHVRLTVRFEPVGAAPLYNDEGAVVLRRGETTSWQNTDVPALRSQGPAPAPGTAPAVPALPPTPVPVSLRQTASPSAAGPTVRQ